MHRRQWISIRTGAAQESHRSHRSHRSRCVRLGRRIPAPVSSCTLIDQTSIVSDQQVAGAAPPSSPPQRHTNTVINSGTAARRSSNPRRPAGRAGAVWPGLGAADAGRPVCPRALRSLAVCRGCGDGRQRHCLWQTARRVRRWPGKHYDHGRQQGMIVAPGGNIIAGSRDDTFSGKQTSGSGWCVEGDIAARSDSWKSGTLKKGVGGI